MKNYPNIKIKQTIVRFGSMKGYIHHRVWIGRHKRIDEYYRPAEWPLSCGKELLDNIYQALE